MSFRGRLTLLFVLIVVLPMIAVGFIVFALIGQNADAKGDAALAEMTTAAYGLSIEDRRAANDLTSAIARDAGLAAAIRDNDREALRARLDALRLEHDAARIVLSRDNRIVADVGDPKAVFPAERELVDRRRQDVGLLEVSVETAPEYARRVARIAEADVVLHRRGEVVASTLGSSDIPDLPAPGQHSVVTVGRDDYRARSFRRPDFLDASSDVTVLAPKDAFAGNATQNRLLAAGILVGFFALAMICALIVSRSLQQQIHELLQAARRLGSGDFSAKVPTKGHDEFAALGEEFNNMSGQLEARLADLRQERLRLEGAMLRIGETFGKSLDREGLLEIVVHTMRDGVEADAGRGSLRGAPGTPETVAVAGHLDGLEGAIHAAEAGALDTGAPTEVTVAGVPALAHPLRGREDGPVTGVVAIARRARAFDEGERRLFHYLAQQAAVSIENAGLHETVERQAVTDELTGLANRRRFDEALQDEVERARRFRQPLGLVLLDLDDFKRINDSHGHQVGDEVLRAVARVLRESCREIDEPARYGGEELAVVLPGTDLGGANRLAERVRVGVERLAVPAGDGGPPLRVTTSVGVATMPDSGSDAASLVEAADDALYRAKRAGKNRTVLAR